jgi:DNA-binding MarR family transcriptional regulator
MEAMGLVLRVNRWGGNKTTHVRLTASGRAEAERLAKEQEESVAALLSALALQLPMEPLDDTQQGA